MEIISRKEWKAEAPRRTLPTKPEDNTGIVVHHTVTPAGGDLFARMRSMQDYHRNTKGWFDLAYNYCIGQDGTIFEGRGLKVRQGATATPKLAQFAFSTQFANKKYYAVSFIGNFENENLSEHAIAAFQWLRAWLMAQGMDDEVRMHKEFKITSSGAPATDCPGKNTQSSLPLLRLAPKTTEQEAKELQIAEWALVKKITYKRLGARFKRIRAIAIRNLERLGS